MNLMWNREMNDWKRMMRRVIDKEVEMRTERNRRGQDQPLHTSHLFILAPTA